MKILFTADWHIKLGQKNVPTDWARSRYQQLFECIEQVPCDIHILGGDLFDKLPTIEELDLYFAFISGTKHPTFIFSGNHEATKKNETFFKFLVRSSHTINKHVNILTLPTTVMDFTLFPYEYLHRKGEIEKLPADKPVFTHVRGEIPPHVKPEVDLERFDRFPMVFAGDLHSYENCQRNIIYPGTPLSISFHKEKQQFGGILIDTEYWTHERVIWDLPQLIKKTITSEDEIVEDDYNHVVYQLKGSLTDLKDITNDKVVEKVVEREDTLSVDLQKLSLTEEIHAYLTEVLNLDENTVKEVIKVYHDSTNTAEME